ncbi:MAG: Hsp20/alpha crystallin family protein [Betaproteobacteria bacterium]|nr:Hsp20/alpha crystallin family protein [Betaproteobacteria bacterium]
MTKHRLAVVEKGKEIQKAVPAARAFRPFDEMERMMERVFGDFPPRGWMRPWRAEWPAFPDLRMPKVDVIERDEDVLVRAELPGVERKDLEISTTDTSVTIKATTRHEEKEEKGDFYHCEISRGSFARTVALPAEVESAKAKASLKDGVLELTLPKVEKSKRHTVTVE